MGAIEQKEQLSQLPQQLTLFSNSIIRTCTFFEV